MIRYISAILTGISIILALIIIYTFPLKLCRPDPRKFNMIRTLIRQAARWSLAAMQDKDIMIAVLHANYGAAYLWALRDIASDNEITHATNINVLKFRDQITAVQDRMTRRLAAACPAYMPPTRDMPYIAHVAMTA